MKIIDKLIRKLGYEYIDDIRIRSRWRRTLPKESKMEWKKYYYTLYGRYQTRITLNKNNTLVDGYTTYLLEKEKGKKIVKVKRV